MGWRPEGGGRGWRPKGGGQRVVVSLFTMHDSRFFFFLSAFTTAVSNVVFRSKRMSVSWSSGLSAALLNCLHWTRLADLGSVRASLYTSGAKACQVALLLWLAACGRHACYVFRSGLWPVALDCHVGLSTASTVLTPIDSGGCNTEVRWLIIHY